MAIAALLHSLRSQTKQLASKSFNSGFHPCRFGTWPHTPTAKPNLNSVTQLATAQKRWASKSTVAEDDNKISIGPQRGMEVGEDEKDRGVVYYGPISSTIKKIKLISLSTFCLSVFLGPVITFMPSFDIMNLTLKASSVIFLSVPIPVITFMPSPDMNLILMASSLIFLTGATTATINYLFKPCIHKLMWQPGSDSFEVEMLSWRATSIRRTIRFADIRLPKTTGLIRPPVTNKTFVLFKANGNFYIFDFLGSDHRLNEALLARLYLAESNS